jgi:hypothetical protein
LPTDQSSVSEVSPFSATAAIVAREPLQATTRPRNRLPGFNVSRRSVSAARGAD